MNKLGTLNKYPIVANRSCTFTSKLGHLNQKNGQCSFKFTHTSFASWSTSCCSIGRKSYDKHQTNSCSKLYKSCSEWFIFSPSQKTHFLQRCSHALVFVHRMTSPNDMLLLENARLICILQQRHYATYPFCLDSHYKHPLILSISSSPLPCSPGTW